MNQRDTGAIRIAKRLRARHRSISRSTISRRRADAALMADAALELERCASWETQFNRQRRVISETFENLALAARSFSAGFPLAHDLAGLTWQVRRALERLADPARQIGILKERERFAIDTLSVALRGTSHPPDQCRSDLPGMAKQVAIALHFFDRKGRIVVSTEARTAELVRVWAAGLLVGALAVWAIVLVGGL